MRIAKVSAQVPAKTMGFKEYLKTVNLRNGGAHFCSGKGYGKSTAMKSVARYYAKQPDTYVIIVDTILNWALDFDKCPMYTVKQGDVRETTKNVEINDGKSYLVWQKQYIMNPEPFAFLKEALKRKQHLILFDVELQEIDKVGVFQAKIIDFLYQRQRIKKKYWKGNLPEQYVIISEETEAVFDNSTLDRKIMSRTRKQYAEMANLRIAMFSCSQRLTEISAKFRGKVDTYLIGHSSIEDFDLKLGRLLRYSKHKRDVLGLPQGVFLDTKTDALVKFPDFRADGTPYRVKRKSETQKPSGTVFYAMPKRKVSALSKIKTALKSIFCVDRADLDKPELWKDGQAFRGFEDDEDDGNALVADNDEQLDESLFW
jgi:hypothetical protein